MGWNIFGFGLGVESFEIELKVLGFWRRIYCLGLLDLAKGLGLRVLGFCLGFGVEGLCICFRVLGLGFFGFSVAFGT